MYFLIAKKKVFTYVWLRTIGGRKVEGKRVKPVK